MIKKLTKSDIKKYIKRIRLGTRQNIISLSNEFLEEKNIKPSDWVDVRTWSKISEEQIKEIKK